MEPEKEYVSVPEAAEMLNLQRNRVGVLCREGRFKGAFKIGDTWAIPRESVFALVRYGPRGKGKNTTALNAEIAQAVEVAKKAKKAKGEPVSTR